MTSPDSSNLNATAGATSFTVNGSATKIADAFAAIEAYLNAPSTPAARSNVAYAAEAFNELVAAVNAFAA